MQELQSYPSQPGPDGQDRLESLRCVLWQAEPHFELTQQPQPLDLIFCGGWPRLLEELTSTLQLPVADKELRFPDLGELDRRVGRFGNGFRHGSPRHQQYDGDCDARSEGPSWQPACPVAPLHHSRLPPIRRSRRSAPRRIARSTIRRLTRSGWQTSEHLPLTRSAESRRQVGPFEYTAHGLVRCTQECPGDLAVVATSLPEGVALHLDRVCKIAVSP